MGGRELARLRCYRIRVDSLGEDPSGREGRVSHQRMGCPDLKVTGKWNTRGCGIAWVYTYGARQWWRRRRRRRPGYDGVRGRACCLGLRAMVRPGPRPALDAELRSTLYPSELLHTLHVPINTMIPQIIPLTLPACWGASVKVSLLIPRSIIRDRFRLNELECLVSIT